MATEQKHRRVLKYKGEGVRTDLTGPFRGLDFYMSGYWIYRCRAPTGAMDEEAAASQNCTEVRHAQ